MAKWTFDAKRYEEDKVAFLYGIREMMDEFFGESNKPRILTLESGAEAEAEEKTPLEKILDALPEVVTEGKWDVGTLPYPDDLRDAILDTCIHLANEESGVCYFALNHGEEEHHISPDFLVALKAFRARCTLEARYDFELDELALLANMDERSAANAVRDEFGTLGGFVEYDKGVTWLSKRRGFKPTTRYNSRIEQQRLDDIKTPHELIEIIEWQARKLAVDPEDLKEITEGLFDTDSTGSLKNEAIFNNPRALAALAERLHWNPSWFVKTAMEIQANWELELLRLEKKQSISETLRSIGLDEAFSDRTAPVRPEELATAENIRTFLGEHIGIWRHPKDKGGHAKIDAYIAENRRVIAHEHNLKQQALWVQADGILCQRINVSRIDNPHNCHSGLGKYPELSHGKLVRFLPKTIEDVKAVVEEVVSAQPIGFIKQDEGEETWH